MRVLPLVLLIASLALACGSSGDPGTDSNGDPDVVLTDLGGSDGEEPGDPGPTPDVPQGDTVAPGGSKVTFAVDSFIPQQVPVNQKYALEARVTDADGAAVPFVGVEFAIAAVEDLNGEEILEWDGVVAPAYAAGDKDGWARSTFTAGAADGFIYTVEAKADGIEEPARIRLVVIQMDCACLDTTLKFEGTLPMGAQLRLLAFPPEVKCADLLAAGATLPTASFQTEGTDPTVPVKFECVLGSRSYTVLATARSGCPVAMGCKEDVAVAAPGETCSTAEIDLAGVTQKWPGTYDATTRLDVAGALPDCTGTPDCTAPATLAFPDQACCYAAEITKLFGTTDAAIADAMVEQGRTKIGLSEADAPKLKAAAEQVLAARTVPAWVEGMLAAGPRLVQSVRQVNALSRITLADGEAEGTLDGTEKWTGYTLYWKAGCDPADPDFYKCGKVTMTSFGVAAYAPTVEDSTFTATLSGLNVVTLAKHAVKLSLGRLLAWMANKVAAPLITGGKIDGNVIKNGAADLAGAVTLWLDCDAVGPALLAQVDSWFNGTDADLVELCKATGYALLAPVDKVQVALVAASSVELTGSAAASDENCDLDVDRLTNGQYTGKWIPATGDAVDLTGDFTAVRVKL